MNDRRAFTLVELLVVIAVIALLIALLVPALQLARHQARTVLCQSNLRQWAMALATYAETNEGRFPSVGGTGGGMWLLRGTFIGDSDPNANHGELHGFQTRGIALCPMATIPSTRGTFGVGMTINGVGWRIEGEGGSSSDAWQILKPEPPFVGSYGYNPALFQSFRFNRIVGSFRMPDLIVSSLREHGSIPVLLDATMPMPPIRSADYAMTSGPQLNTGDGWFSGLNPFVMDRHGRATNGVFLDWSVRKVGLKELWTLKWASDFDRAGRWTKAGGVQPGDWPEWMRQCKDY